MTTTGISCTVNLLRLSTTPSNTQPAIPVITVTITDPTDVNEAPTVKERWSTATNVTTQREGPEPEFVIDEDHMVEGVNLLDEDDLISRIIRMMFMYLAVATDEVKTTVVTVAERRRRGRLQARGLPTAAATRSFTGSPSRRIPTSRIRRTRTRTTPTR